MNTRIRKLRRTLDLTQQVFAERIGMKQNSIALIESGKRNISDQALLSICREFGVNEEWLRNGTGEMFLPNSTIELDALARRYNMSQAEYTFFEKYFKLKKEERDIVFSFIQDIANTIASPNASSVSTFSDSEQPMDSDAVISSEAKYEKSLGIVQNTKYSVSSTIKGTDPNRKEA